ncbi:ropporin-1-like protein [Penaeus monodon]|uniref:ropporin-1-like protein n=1 Tax=Penaeus monodon TaxID=6687 RepID=UPI0018A7381C|nr:ropporin-1-like protein [Penaeus monodon]XP_037777823.1 ropporin-1-like protein [Penaeus monodon]
MVASAGTGARVPAALPRILKDYTKAAIRTQPKDLLTWSVAYFRSMTNGTVPPVKDRLEFPVPESKGGISPGILRVLHRQLGSEGSIEWGALQEVCGAMGVEEAMAQEAWKRAGGGDKGAVEWDHILTHIAGLATHSDAEALQLVMATISEDPVGHKVQADTIVDHLHRLHTHSNIVPTDQYNDTVGYLNDIANYQDGFLAPSDLTRPSCPLIN